MVRGSKAQSFKPVQSKRSSASVSNNKQSTASPGVAGNKGTKRAAATIPTCSSLVMSCSACGIVIGNDGKALQCDRCQSNDSWKCIDCLDLSSEVYDYLMVNENCSLKWFCDKCDMSNVTGSGHQAVSDAKIDSLLGLVEKLLEDRNKMEVKMSTKADIQQTALLEERINKMEIEMSNKADIQQIALLEEAVEIKVDKIQLDHLEDRIAHIERNLGSLTQNDNDEFVREPEVTVNDNLSELREREARKENLIIFNIPESTCEDTDNRKLYDVTQATELIESELNVPTGVGNPVRLGKKQPNSKYPRPLRVTVDSEQLKWKVLKASKNLRESRNEEYKVIFTRSPAVAEGPRERAVS